VAIFARAGVPMAEASLLPNGGVIEEARCVAAHVNLGISGGIAFVSLYLCSGEGVSERNVNLIARVAEWLFRLGRPYMWAADWQNTPEQIGFLGVIQQLRGTICAPERLTRGTCAPAGRVIDFFVAHQSLSRPS
jgi:hypothetical protein